MCSFAILSLFVFYFLCVMYDRQNSNWNRIFQWSCQSYRSTFVCIMSGLPSRSCLMLLLVPVPASFLVFLGSVSWGETLRHGLVHGWLLIIIASDQSWLDNLEMSASQITSVPHKILNSGVRCYQSQLTSLVSLNHAINSFITKCGICRCGQRCGLIDCYV